MGGKKQKNKQQEGKITVNIEKDFGIKRKQKRKKHSEEKDYHETDFREKTKTAFFGVN